MKLYHVVANIDSRFKSIEDAVNKYNICTPIQPYIPKTAAINEDTETPRIPVALSIEECITGLGLLGRFRRCLAANEDAKSYETKGNEVYPILIVEFDEYPYYPSIEEVPDVYQTGELWLLHPTIPTNVYLVWLHPRSIIWQEPIVDKYTIYENHIYKCKEIRVLGWDEVIRNKKDHPWLNGRGHVLESSEMEDDYYVS